MVAESQACRKKGEKFPIMSLESDQYIRHIGRKAGAEDTKMFCLCGEGDFLSVQGYNPC